MKIHPWAQNDDLSSKFDNRINSTDKQLLDCPVNANMASEALFGQSSNCLSVLCIILLIRGRRLGL